MRKAPAVFIALFCASTLAAFAQGNFLKKGQFGLGLNGAFITNSDASGFMGTAVVALGGIFDLSFGVGRAAYDDSQELADLKATTLSPELRAHVIKQNSSKSPVSLSLSIGHSRDNFSSPDLDAVGYTFKANSVVVGAALYRDMRLFRRVMVQPTVGLTHTSSTFKLTNDLGQTLSDKGGIVTFQIGLPLVYTFSWRTLVVLQPGLTLNKDTTAFAVSVGLVYVFNKPPAE
jgi:hypothetical protein